ncbi:heme peroxidase [Trichoderma chlorosporum]
MPLKNILAIVGALPLVSAGCPHINGNSNVHVARSGFQHPESILEPRFSADGPDFGQCPRKSTLAGGGTRSRQWWPCELNLAVLRQFSEKANPLDADFDYATAFAGVDVAQLKKDITAVQTTSQSWWPADFGNYGPFFIRLAWHNAGTYRATDGRGGAGMGQQRFAPLNSWPDNANLDKARRLLWPIKQKYGSALSWADLFVFAGNTALENMGFPTYGFGFGRVDTWQSDEGIYWGGEQEMFPEPLNNVVRYDNSTDFTTRASELESPLGAVSMGLIYVDPRGPNGNPDTKASALDIRETFGRMGMDDEETVALIAGGHAFGKTHGAVSGDDIGPEPNAADIQLQGLGWANSAVPGNGVNAYTSGLEVIWSRTPTQWANGFLNSLLKNNFTLTTSPGGAPQWEALDANASIPDPFIAGKFRRPTMLTSDLGLRDDPIYNNISTTFLNDFDYFTQKFGLAWYKLLHRDMGPISRYLGPEIPTQPPLIWQDPLPAPSYTTLAASDITSLKQQILAAPGLNISNLVTTAWGAASSFRISDKRGGANGARIFLQPQANFTANNPTRLATVLKGLKGVQSKFQTGSKKVSLADLVVLGGNAAIESAAHAAGITLTVPFTPGRVDALQNETDVSTFAFLQPQADGFRNYGVGTATTLTEEFLVDKASLLTLSPPEMTVLVGGMRALNANFDGSSTGILTTKPGQLTNDFFVNLLGSFESWSVVNGTNSELFQSTNSAGKVQWTASRSDLIFGSHPELRAVSEVYGSSDGQTKFVNDFVAAWAKVMNLDRYDVKGSSGPTNAY